MQRLPTKRPVNRTLRTLLLAGALGGAAVGLSGCMGLTIAGIAANVVSSAIGGGGPQQAAAPSPSEQIYEGLSQIDDRVSPSCSAKLASRTVPGSPDAAAAGAEPSNRPNAWGHPEWSFANAASEPSAAPAAGDGGASQASAPARLEAARPDSVAGKRCGIRPTCLPGMRTPVPMMVCGDEDPAAPGPGSATPADASASPFGSARATATLAEGAR
jgi:hypothetical protein